MKHPWREIEPGPASQPNVFVEIPRGTRTKYELDIETGFMRVDRVLYSSFVYPCNYGFIPQTLAEDNDPVDCFILGREILPLSLIQVRPVALLRTLDQGVADHKVLCVPRGDPRFEQVHDLPDVPQHDRQEVEYFISHYKDLEERDTVARDWQKREVAQEEIEAGMKRFRDRFGPAAAEQR